MRRIISFLIISIIVMACIPPGKNVGPVPWQHRLGQLGDDIGNGIAFDAQENLFISGSIGPSADLDGNQSIDPILPETEPNGTHGDDIVVVKATVNGSFLWAKRLGGLSSDSGYGVAADSTVAVYIVGSIGDAPADLDGNGSSNDNAVESTSLGGLDGFVSKFSGDGTWLWSKRIGGVGDDALSAVTVDSGHNVVFCGRVTGDADLDGDGSAPATAPETADAAIYGDSWDGFVTKLDADGTVIWMKRLGGLNFDIAYGVRHDSVDDIIVVGMVDGQADLNGDGDASDAQETAGLGSFDSFITKFSADGSSSSWAKRIGGSSVDIGYAVSVDSNNNVFLSGAITGTADLNGDSDTADAGETGTAGNKDGFISAFSSIGVSLWTKRIGGEGSDEIRSVAAGIGNTVIVTGSVEGSADLNGDTTISATFPETISVGVHDLSDAFFSRFSNVSGSFVDAGRIGGMNADSGRGIAGSPTGGWIVTGSVIGSADLDGSGTVSGTHPETAGGFFASTDVFITRLLLP